MLTEQFDSVLYAVDICVHLASETGCLDRFLGFSSVSSGKILSYCMKLVHVCFHLDSFKFIIIFVPFNINGSEVLLNQE
jgi:uncharacterized protein Smg (DUF494 family)